MKERNTEKEKKINITLVEQKKDEITRTHVKEKKKNEILMMIMQIYELLRPSDIRYIISALKSPPRILEFRAGTELSSTENGS